MKLLHGSNLVIDAPDLKRCHSKNDFGRGFYLTPDWRRAWEMGRRRKNFYGGDIIVNVFLFYPSICRKKGLRIKEFKGFTEEWARFIIQNRIIANFQHDYDVVIGPVADAILDKELRDYQKQFGDHILEETNLKVFASRVNQFGSSYVQYCFCTERGLNELFKY